MLRPVDPIITRRRALAIGLGAVVAAGCNDDRGGGSVVEESGADPVDPTPAAPSTSDGAATATSSSSTTTAPTPPPESPLTTADFETVESCTPTPGQTSGPFYLRADLVRSDITEGRPGSPLRLGLRVEDTDCHAVPDARVDIWHADLDGDYSAFLDESAPDEEGEGSTFLRGTQLSGPDGIVDFRTVFPGWYPQRAVHIHVMVYLDRNRVLTSQLYFSDDVIADVYRSAPYSERGSPDLPTDRDRIAGDVVAQGLQLAVTGDDAGRLALHRLHVTP